MGFLRTSGKNPNQFEPIRALLSLTDKSLPNSSFQAGQRASPYMTIKLSPTQLCAYHGLQAGLAVGNVILLWGDTGLGKTTVLRELHAKLGGCLLTLKDFMDAQQSRHPLSLEETFAQLVMQALQSHDVVIVDDLGVLSGVMHGCGAYPRSGFLEVPLTALATYAIEAGKKLICAGSGSTALQQRGYQFGIDEFDVEDYAFLCDTYLGAELASLLDYPKIFRFATKLNAHQLKAACLWLKRDETLDTERFIEYLRSQYLASNVNLG